MIAAGGNAAELSFLGWPLFADAPQGPRPRSQYRLRWVMTGCCNARWDGVFVNEQLACSWEVTCNWQTEGPWLFDRHLEGTLTDMTENRSWRFCRIRFLVCITNGSFDLCGLCVDFYTGTASTCQSSKGAMHSTPSLRRREPRTKSNKSKIADSLLRSGKQREGSLEYRMR